MPRWDSADLLDQLLDVVDRPTTDEALGTDKAYRYLTLGQDYWLEQLAVHVPEAMWTPLVKLAAGDDPATFVLPAEAVGPIYLFSDAFGTPMDPGPEWSADYILEDQLIRIPESAGGASRSFADGPYARYVPAAADAIDADHAPILKPARARRLIVLRAAILFASQGGGTRSPDYYYNLEKEAWTGREDDDADVGLLGSLKRQYQGNYGGHSGAAWWNSPDLGPRRFS